jgi:hypothetical protein
MSGKKILLACVAALVLLAGGWLAWTLLHREPEKPQSLFADWAAIVVAGDWRAQSGNPSKVFDNGRRAIADKLAGMGFSRDNMLQFSAQAGLFPYEGVQDAADEPITKGLTGLAQKAPGGCLVYFTSHGTHDGIIIGERIVDPPPIAARIAQACGERPTVVIVSACFAGQFIPALRGGKRVVFTAARADRSSFGCGEQDQYTFFDACVLSEIDKVGNFSDLAIKVDDCVEAREKAMKVSPPSEPQFFIGPDVTYTLNWK